MPLGLHHLFGVPMGLALQMATHQTQVVLHDGHGVAVGISGNGFKAPPHKGGPIVKIHALRAIAPQYRRCGAIRRTDVCLGAFDVLHRTGAPEKVKIICIRPIGAHAYAQVLATALHEGPNLRQIGLEHMAKCRGFSIPTREHHHVHIVKKTIQHFVHGEQLDAGHGRQSGHHPIDRIGRARGLVQEDSDGFCHLLEIQGLCAN